MKKAPREPGRARRPGRSRREEARQRREAAPESSKTRARRARSAVSDSIAAGFRGTASPGFRRESVRQRDFEDRPDAGEKKLVRREAAAEGEGAPSDGRERLGAPLRRLADRAAVGGVHRVRHDMRRARETEHDGGPAPEEESRERGAAERADLERAALPARIARMDAQETHGAAGSTVGPDPTWMPRRRRSLSRRGPEWIHGADPKDTARRGGNGELEPPPCARRQRHAPAQRVVEEDVEGRGAPVGPPVPDRQREHDGIGAAERRHFEDPCRRPAGPSERPAARLSLDVVDAGARGIPERGLRGPGVPGPRDGSPDRADESAREDDRHDGDEKPSRAAVLAERQPGREQPHERRDLGIHEMRAEQEHDAEPDHRRRGRGAQDGLVVVGVALEREGAAGGANHAEQEEGEQRRAREADSASVPR